MEESRLWKNGRDCRTGGAGRDRIARLVRYRGDWNKEWSSYGPEVREIATAFVAGINAYIHSLGSKRPLEFRLANYDPGTWVPEDVLTRIAGLEMVRNVSGEVERSIEVASFGLEATQRFSPPDPFVKFAIPTGLDVRAISQAILKDFNSAISGLNIGDQGSNNWVVDGTLSVTGKPMLANDPHRTIGLPSLRKTWHLVAPGWNIMGAGEPALPGIALGHNERVGFGLTIVGTDQADLFAEKVNPSNANQYWFQGKWTNMEVERDQFKVKGGATATVDLKYTRHGPVIYQDATRRLAYALKWVGADPGGAGYLGALMLSRSKNWKQFLEGIEHYKIPSENMIYADVDGNIGWVTAGAIPVRKSGNGLFPIPGGTDAQEWTGYLPVAEVPQVLNPARHFIATANHKILPSGYTKQISYDWTLPFRYQRIEQMLGEAKKFGIADFERMQQDVLSLPAQRFQKVVAQAQLTNYPDLVAEFLKWDARLTLDSRPGLVYELWISELYPLVYPARWTGRLSIDVVLKELEARNSPKLLAEALDRAVAQIQKNLPDRKSWRWDAAHTLVMRHPLNRRDLNLPPVGRPGDNYTVNASGSAAASGASYRQILDLANWDRSVMTNVPGESGDPGSRHYKDLLSDWAGGRYHPMPYSRQAVEAALDEKILLEP